MSASDNQQKTRKLGSQARALVRSRDRGSIATAMKDDGWPYASLVMMACDGAANPLLMISKLAVHTQNILTENRVSLLIDGTDGLDNPLTGARVTLVGHAEKTSDTDDLARYIARHPDSAMYADFADFALYRLDVERVHMVAGFGAIHWIEKAAYAVDMAFANNLKAAEPDIVCHMNEDHADALQLYATSLLGQAGAGWIMTGIDPEGCDLRCGGTVARLVFDTPVGTTEEARATLVALAGKARETG